MRLLTYKKSRWRTGGYTFSLTQHNPQQLPKYAILSHRWGSDEVLFQDITNGKVKAKEGGYRKLQFCADQAIRDGLHYFWVDTCCIDKTSSAELQEAINSMFRYYKHASKCYVYLSDVSARGDWKSALTRSQWFTRGWTLQELLAPTVVEFYSVDGTKLGDKRSLERQIRTTTRISVEALRGKPLSDIDVKERFAWTAGRRTTVEEDEVYCLLGIFDVHMPLIYSEGSQKALARMQREIQHAIEFKSSVAKIAPWIVPFERNLNFTGREFQLMELQGKIFAESHASRIAIYGHGGVGKTQLALELLHRTKTQRPDCLIMWISARTNTALEQGYFTVAKQLGIPGYNDIKANVKQLVRSYLEKVDAGPWLLVFDNADDIEMWTALPLTRAAGRDEAVQSSTSRPRGLIDLLPQNRRGCIIFTTRGRKAATILGERNIVTVPEMRGEAATQLLQRSLAAPDLTCDPDDVSALLAALTHLPLAISHAVAYINLNKITLTDYISLLAAKKEEASQILSEEFEDDERYRDVKNPVVITWLISFEQIRRCDPLAAKYLSFIACIDPRDIPQSLLPPGTSRKQQMDAIATLAAHSFVTQRSASTSLDLHRLVHLATRNWLRKEDVLRKSMKDAIARVTEIFPDGTDHEDRTTWRSLLPHAQQVLASDLVKQDGGQTFGLLWKYGSCLYRDGRWAEAEASFVEDLMMKKKILGTGHLNTSDTMLYLASTYCSQGRYKEAEQLEVQALEIRKTKLGADHLHTLNSMNNLASTYSNQGRYKEAEQLQVQVLEIYKAKLGAEHPNTLGSMNNLATTYSNQGRYKEAEQLQVQVLEIHKTKLGAEHPHTLNGLNNLASIYSRRGRYKEAEQLQVQVLEIRKTKLGAKHPDTLTAMHNLAQTWQELGRDVEAIELMRECVNRRTHVLGTSHPHTQNSQAWLDEWEAEHSAANIDLATGEDEP